jgi:hypothetical protein
VYDLWSTRTRVSIAAATLPWLLMAPLLLTAMGNQSLHSSKGQVIWSKRHWSHGVRPDGAGRIV